jgi:hypothetical protein
MVSLYAEVLIGKEDALEFRFDYEIMREYVGEDKDSFIGLGLRHWGNILSESITEWNLTTDEGESAPIVPITFYNELSVEVITKIYTAIGSSIVEYLNR